MPSAKLASSRPAPKATERLTMPLRVLLVDSFVAPGPIASSKRLFLRFAHRFFGRFAPWCVEREWQ